ncbi:MAG: DUF4115 domain-containing protein [Syntrophobacterales bacterium]|jgi:cytoskeleton protein RodZ|nr:DUF4115 domain-containing protein [Syntrophobacterales bacterium]
MIDTDTPHLEQELDNTSKALPLAKYAPRREELGLTLSDIFGRTRITIKNLTALEQEDFASLPAPVYTQGFIRQYAKLLNIDPAHALQEYDDYLKSASAPVFLAEKPDAPQNNFSQIQTPTNKSSHVPVLSVILAIVLFGFFIFLLENNTTQQRTLSAKNQQAAENPSASQEGEEGMAEDASGEPVNTAVLLTGEALQKSVEEIAATVTASGPLKLTIKARETTWIAVRADGQNKEQTLYAGGTATFTGKCFSVNIGNAGGTDVFLQGKFLGALGKKGEAVRIVLPSKNCL